MKNLMLLSLICLIYIFISIAVNQKDIFNKSYVPHFNYLIEAFLANRLDVRSPYGYDLSLFNNKWYLYWGPSPVLVIFPFYLIWGVNASDIFYTLTFGLMNVVIFYFLLNEVAKYFDLRHTQFAKMITLTAFALSSPHLYLSVAGRIWHTDQIIAIFYLLLFLLFLFKFQSSKKILWLIFSIIFFNLSWMARYTLFLYFPLLLILINIYKRGWSYKFSKILSSIFLISIPFFIFFFYYNFSRFGNILEPGYKYQQGSRYGELFMQNKIFSLNYFADHLYYYFLNPLRIKLEPFFIKIDPEGNSVFMTYPLFSLIILVPTLVRGLKSNAALISEGKNLFIFLATSLLIYSSIILIMLTNVGTGWTQFGSRYFLDVIPLLLLNLLLVIHRLPKYIPFLLVILGAMINIVGTMEFYSHF